MVPEPGPSPNIHYRNRGKKIKEYAGKVISEARKRAKEGASAIMELREGKNIDGFDEGNGAAYVGSPSLAGVKPLHGRSGENVFATLLFDRPFI